MRDWLDVSRQCKCRRPVGHRAATPFEGAQGRRTHSMPSFPLGRAWAKHCIVDRSAPLQLPSCQTPDVRPASPRLLGGQATAVRGPTDAGRAQRRQTREPGQPDSRGQACSEWHAQAREADASCCSSTGRHSRCRGHPRARRRLHERHAGLRLLLQRRGGGRHARDEGGWEDEPRSTSQARRKTHGWQAIRQAERCEGGDEAAGVERRWALLVRVGVLLLLVLVLPLPTPATPRLASALLLLLLLLRLLLHEHLLVLLHLLLLLQEALVLLHEEGCGSSRVRRRRCCCSHPPATCVRDDRGRGWGDGRSGRLGPGSGGGLPPSSAVRVVRLLLLLLLLRRLELLQPARCRAVLRGPTGRSPVAVHCAGREEACAEDSRHLRLRLLVLPRLRLRSLQVRLRRMHESLVRLLRLLLLRLRLLRGAQARRRCRGPADAAPRAWREWGGAPGQQRDRCSCRRSSSSSSRRLGGRARGRRRRAAGPRWGRPLCRCDNAAAAALFCF